MITLDCPWCEAPVALERPEAVRCETCRIEVELDTAPPAGVEVPLAA